MRMRLLTVLPLLALAVLPSTAASTDDDRPLAGARAADLAALSLEEGRRAERGRLRRLRALVLGGAFATAFLLLFLLRRRPPPPAPPSPPRPDGRHRRRGPARLE